LGGDFNVTLFYNERSGGARRRRAVVAFADFTAEQGLMDLPLLGGVFLWSNNLSWSRLDHFLVSSEWELNYLDLMQKKLIQVCSDHTPILLVGGGRQSRKRSFKFEYVWLKEEGFVEKVRN
jgi:endonuclease/exonuclease/phosphatase family metal-dependent hydrolase